MKTVIMSRIGKILFVLWVFVFYISYYFPDFIDKEGLLDFQTSVYDDHWYNEEKLEAAKQLLDTIYNSSVWISFLLEDVWMILIYIWYTLYLISRKNLIYFFSFHKKTFFGFILLYNFSACIFDIAHYIIWQYRYEYPIWADSIGIAYMWSVANSIALFICMMLFASPFFLNKKIVILTLFSYKNYFSFSSFVLWFTYLIFLILLFWITLYSLFVLEFISFLQNLGLTYFFLYLFLFYGSIEKKER